MKVYLIGVCGTAMATLAAMLRDRGHAVHGSDAHVYPPMSDFLAARGITCLDGFDEAHFLAPLEEIVARGTTAAEQMVTEYHSVWGGSIEPVFLEYAY